MSRTPFSNVHVNNIHVHSVIPEDHVKVAHSVKLLLYASSKICQTTPKWLEEDEHMAGISLQMKVANIKTI